MSCVLFSVEIRLSWQMFDPELRAGTLFVLLLKFGTVLSIICGFLIAISWWRRILQCIVTVRSFLRLLKLRKLAVGKLDFLLGVTVC